VIEVQADYLEFFHGKMRACVPRFQDAAFIVHRAPARKTR
jgi:hypothetical protein